MSLTKIGETNNLVFTIGYIYNFVGELKMSWIGLHCLFTESATRPNQSISCDVLNRQD